MTTRANPNASWEAACRHLFRHIDRARELRRNPIVAHYFPEETLGTADSDAVAVDAIRRAALVALDASEAAALASGRSDACRRRRTILEAHTLGRQSARATAAALHLSRSHFFRERRALHEEIARAIDRGRSRRSSPVAVALARDAIAMDRARYLAESCEGERAVEVLQNLAKNGSDPAAKIVARCLAARLLTADLRHADAERAIADVRAMLHEHETKLSEARGRLCRAHFHFARARALSALGCRDEEARALPDALRALGDPGQIDGDAGELTVDVLLFAAERAQENGSLPTSRRYLARAQTLAATIPYQRPRHTTALLSLSSLLCNDPAAPATFEASIRLQAEAREGAQRAGLIVSAIHAGLTLSSIYAFGLEDHATALEHALPIVDLAVQIGNPVLIAAACLTTAEIHVEGRRFAEALRLLATAKHRGKQDALTEASVLCVASEAYFGLREYARAASLARTAHGFALQLKNRRLEQGALRIAALAQHRSGQPRLARASIERAIELADPSGPRISTALTYGASANITGNRAHAQLARELNPRIGSSPLAG